MRDSIIATATAARSSTRRREHSVQRRTPTPLIARAQELAAIAAAAERALSEAAFVLLTAPAGFGKSALLAEVVHRLDDRRVVRLSADSFESDLAYTTAEAVARAVGAPWPDVRSDGAADPLDVGRVILDAVDGLREPICIVVDDAQWVDAASARALRFVMRRLDTQPLLVLVAGRPEPTPLTAAFPPLSEADPLAALTLTLPPFTAEDTQELAAAILGRPVSHRAAARLTRSCGGSPLLVSSALRNARSAGPLGEHPAVDDFVATGDSSLTRRVADTLARADDAARDTTVLVAVLRDPTSIVGLRAIGARLGCAVDVDGAVALGLTRLCERDGVTMIEPEHALLADSVVASVPHSERLRLHAAAAAEFGGHRALRHRVEAADAADVSLGNDLLRAAQSAAETGHPDYAIEIALSALRRAGSDTAAEAELLAPVGLIALRTRRHERVLALIPSFESLPPSLVRDQILLELYTLDGRMEDAGGAGRRILADASPTPEARAIRAVAAEAVARLHLAVQDFAPVVEQTRLAVRLVADAPSDPSELSDPTLRWLVSPREIVVRSLGWRIAGAARMGDVPTILATIDELDVLFAEGPDGPATADALVTRARVFLGMGNLDRALEDLARVDSLLRRFSTAWTGGIGRAIYAHILFLTGEWDASVTVADTAVGLALDETNLSGWPIALAVSALVRAARGEKDAAEERLRAAADASARWSFSAYDVEIAHVARAESARAHGDRAGQLAATDEIATGERLTGSSHAWMSYRIDALAALGRPDEARVLLDLCRDPRTGWRPTSGSLDWLAGRVAESAGDAHGASEAYERAVADPANARFPFALAVARVDRARVLTTERRTEEAIVELGAAIDAFRLLGAAPYLARAVAALATVERSPADTTQRSPHADPFGALTTRERQVAYALSTGLTNREIAESLYVSVTTVNFHVRNVLAKLGLSSRRDLRGLVGPRSAGIARRSRRG